MLHEFRRSWLPDWTRTMIQNTIKEGKIVPSEVTVRLLQKATEECNSNNFFDWWLPSEWIESCCVWACGRLRTSQTLLSLSIPAILELQWHLEPVSLVTWSKSFLLGNLFAKFSFGGFLLIFQNLTVLNGSLIFPQVGKLYKCWSGMEEAIFGFTLPCLTFCSWVGMVEYADGHRAREFILFFDCPEEEMEKRMLSRNQVKNLVGCLVMCLKSATCMGILPWRSR